MPPNPRYQWDDRERKECVFQEEKTPMMCGYKRRRAVPTTSITQVVYQDLLRIEQDLIRMIQTAENEYKKLKRKRKKRKFNVDES